MSSFYGNVKNLVRSPFIFDRIYSSRKKMEDSLLNGGDGVFINRYVLVNYGFDAEGAIYVAIDPKQVSNNPSDTSNETQYLVIGLLVFVLVVMVVLLLLGVGFGKEEETPVEETVQVETATVGVWNCNPNASATDAEEE